VPSSWPERHTRSLRITPDSALVPTSLCAASNGGNRPSSRRRRTNGRRKTPDAAVTVEYGLGPDADALVASLSAVSRPAVRRSVARTAPAEVPEATRKKTGEGRYRTGPVVSSAPVRTLSPPMADRRELLSVLVALEFVVLAAAVFLLVPIEAAAPLLPLFLVLSYALYRYAS
jgi:hypothetical protein